MINITTIINLKKNVKEKGRLIDYHLIENIFEDRQKEIINELIHYQNRDGGFGHGLEPDVLLPLSSVLCTDEAVMILDEVNNFDLKKDLINDIVKYYESVFITSKDAWELVPNEVDNYPRAIWWNYEGVNNFTYGNPNPQVIGFMYKYKQYVNDFDIDYHLEKVVKYINNQLLEEASKHNILSCLLFYKYVSKEIKEKVYKTLQKAVDLELENYNTNEYCLEPYEILLIDRKFLDNHITLLKENLDKCKKKIDNGLIMPNWSWAQYMDVFEKQQYKWAGYLTFTILKVLLMN